MTNYQRKVLHEIDIEVKVKGPQVVAEELGISESAVRELAPQEAKAHDEAKG